MPMEVFQPRQAVAMCSTQKQQCCQFHVKRADVGLSLKWTDAGISHGHVRHMACVFHVKRVRLSGAERRCGALSSSYLPLMYWRAMAAHLLTVSCETPRLWHWECGVKALVIKGFGWLRYGRLQLLHSSRGELYSDSSRQRFLVKPSYRTNAAYEHITRAHRENYAVTPREAARGNPDGIAAPRVEASRGSAAKRSCFA